MNVTNPGMMPGEFFSLWNGVACTNVAKHFNACTITGNEFSLYRACVIALYITVNCWPSDMENGIKFDGVFPEVSACVRNGLLPYKSIVIACIAVIRHRTFGSRKAQLRIETVVGFSSSVGNIACQ